MLSPRAKHCLLAVLLLAACGQPDARIVGAGEVSPTELQRWSSARTHTLVDVREPADFAQGHIPGARSVPMQALDAFFASRGAEPPIVTICYHGHLAAQAAAIAHSHGQAEVYVLAGGFEAWRSAGLPIATGADMVPAPSGALPRRNVSLFTQFALVLSGFCFKPLYMCTAAALAFVLRRRREPDLRLLFWSLVSFDVGEAFCMVNYLLTGDSSTLLEAGHMLGMVGMNALLPWSFFLMADRRLIGLSGPDTPCMGQRFCRHCWKHGAPSCGLHRLFQMAMPALAVLALLPLCSALRGGGSVIIPVFGTDVHFGPSLGEEILEFRVFPLLAVVFFYIAFLASLRHQHHVAAMNPPFFLGLGFALFPLMRFFLLRGFADVPPWADTWEETTELLMVLLVAVLLWIFRRQLGLATPPATKGT